MRKSEARNPKSERRPKSEFGTRQALDNRKTFRVDQSTPEGRCEPRSSIRAITFDVGGTLIECKPSVGHIYSEVAARHGYLVPSELLNRRFKAAWHSARVFRHTRADWSALVDATFVGLIHPLPSETFFSELYKRFSKPDAWRVYDDVLPTLEALKSRGMKLGIVSNWDERLRPLLQKLNLNGYFDTIVVSCEVGACKPAAELFRVACSRLGFPPNNTLHIGDDFEKDVRGARAAGLQAWNLKRRGGCELSSVLGRFDKL